jgi:glyoxalase/bleomycin resistance protein/dioxygenase superfamily protein
MSDTPLVVSEKALSNSFLSNTMQIVMISRDLRRAMQAMVRLGVGPWNIYTLGPHNVTESFYKGKPSDFVIKVALAFVGSVMWEIIQPISGECAQSDFLNKHGDGIHHIAADCAGLDWDQRVAEFERRGFRLIQMGKWHGRVPFGYFLADDAPGLVIESVLFPDDFVLPEPEERFPA